MITDEIRAKLENHTAVLWCAHATRYGYNSSTECCRFAVRTAVCSNAAIHGMQRDLHQLVEQRAQHTVTRGLAEWTPSKGSPEVYVWPDPEAVTADPGAWSLLIAVGEAVGVHVIEGRC